jgi:hypothetical protein
MYSDIYGYDHLAVSGHWGTIDSVKTISTGIIFVTTPSHGGYILNKDRYAEMHPTLREASFSNDQCFEEDCSWCAVCLMWPEYFPAAAIKAAEQTWKSVYEARLGPLSSIFPDRF